MLTVILMCSFYSQRINFEHDVLIVFVCFQFKIIIHHVWLAHSPSDGIGDGDLDIRLISEKQEE